LQDRIERMAKLAWESGCDGLVCSAADLPRLRAAIGPEMLIVTPGIRPAGASTDDQHRVTTPREAMDSGADFLVIGRPITQAPDPAAALAAIAQELA
jgi:orotidine-5'-phosphate decarboxylase